MSKIYLGTLDEKRQAVFEKLIAFKRNGVLAGGTAIALQINHRLSFDFDIFFKGEISEYLKENARKVLGFASQVIKNETNQFDLLTPGNIKVTFVKHPFPPLHPLIKTDSISLFNLRDLASNKAYTIGYRGTWRDYVDLFFLLKDKYVEFAELINETKKRFGGRFNEILFLKQLAYTKDLGDFNIRYTDKKHSREEIVLFLKQTQEEYNNKVFKK